MKNFISAIFIAAILFVALQASGVTQTAGGPYMVFEQYQCEGNQICTVYIVDEAVRINNARSYLDFWADHCYNIIPEIIVTP